jgi:cobalt/nickel transport system permease protein
MSDALISPAVGGAMWAAAGATMAHGARRMRREVDSARVPLMGVLAAFVFAGQMINFTIPGTGSSGHLGGGMILAALLGPSPAFLAMASILTVQALFFADGGLLALGCNIVNLGFFPAFVAYPLLFRPLAGERPSPVRLSLASVAAAVLGLQMGALSLIVQTVASGVSDLPFTSFATLMLPIHLAIGFVEGLVTAAVVSFVWKARPEVLEYAATGRSLKGVSTARMLGGLAAASLLIGGTLSWFASTDPDGLEWSIGKVSGREKVGSPSGLHGVFEELQEETALFPDYDIRENGRMKFRDGGDESWPAPSAGTSLAGVVGGVLSLLFAIGMALIVRWRSGRNRRQFGA